MHVILLGLRGSGKSTIAPMLARKLGREWIDLDQRTTALLGGSSVREVWDALGEGAFRGAETRALVEALRDDTPRVIALGGGTPTAPGAAAALLDAQGARRAVLVYLRGTPDTLRARLAAGAAIADRPAITGTSALDEVPLLFQRRDPLYSRLADRVIAIDNRTPEQTLRDVGVALGAVPKEG